MQIAPTTAAPPTPPGARARPTTAAASRPTTDLSPDRLRFFFKTPASEASSAVLSKWPQATTTSQQSWLPASFRIYTAQPGGRRETMPSGLQSKRLEPLLLSDYATTCPPPTSQKPKTIVKTMEFSTPPTKWAVCLLPPPCMPTVCPLSAFCMPFCLPTVCLLSRPRFPFDVLSLRP